MTAYNAAVALGLIVLVIKVLLEAVAQQKHVRYLAECKSAQAKHHTPKF